MEKVYPQKLKPGDKVRVIAPSQSASIIVKATRKLANENLLSLGLAASFSRNANEIDEFNSSSIESRIEDLHTAFADTEIAGILTVIGGFNSNQLLKYIDWTLIKNNPKVFCGYSDITVLGNAIYAKTGLVTYSGMHYSTFGQKKLQNYNTKYFKKCLFLDDPFEILPSEKWSDDKWYLDQENRNFMPNEGWWIINEGRAKGTALGGNLATFRLLYGTEFTPSLKDSVLFLEDDNFTANDIAEFDRNLQALIHQPGFQYVSGLVIGRFQQGSKVTKDKLLRVIKTKKELADVPVIGNVDFGHTDPLITFPIGGNVEIEAGNSSRIKFIKH